MSRFRAKEGFRLTGWHVLAGLVVFFGAVVGVDAVMVVDSYATYPGEVSSQPYADGLAWDSELDQQREQAALGWRMTAGVGADGVIRLTAEDRAGAPVSFTRIDARLERPATEQGKRQVRFVETSPGAYLARPGPLHGAWDLRLSAFDAQGREFHAERRMLWP